MKEQETLINFKDLYLIRSMANDEFVRLPAEVEISNKKVDQRDLVTISVANSMLVWLNSKGLLTNLVSFDFTESSTQFEETE